MEISARLKKAISGLAVLVLAWGATNAQAYDCGYWVKDIWCTEPVSCPDCGIVSCYGTLTCSGDCTSSSCCEQFGNNVDHIVGCVSSYTCNQLIGKCELDWEIPILLSAPEYCGCIYCSGGC